MFAIVDIGRPKEGRTDYYGVMDLDTRTLKYYNTAEMIKFIKNMKYNICGLRNLKHNNVKDYIERILDNAEIIQVPEITFLDDPDCYEARHGHYLRYGDKYLSCVRETIFLKPLKLEKLTEGIHFWYKGINLVYKKRKKGFNVSATDSWNAKGGMTNEKFICNLNEINNVCNYTIISLYRTRLPYCNKLDLTGLCLPNLEILREFAWHNNSLKEINFGTLNLSQITDWDKLFHDNAKIEIIDMSNCVGDIRENNNFSFFIKSKNCLLLLPKQAKILFKTVNLTENYKNNTYYTLFMYMGTFKKPIDYNIMKNNLKVLKGKQLLISKDEKFRNSPICLVSE